MTIEAENAPRAAVLREALLWLGTPYRHQGDRRGVGCDCLGLVLGIWSTLYGGAPETPGPYSEDWAEAGGDDRLLRAARRHFTEIETRHAQAGDLLVFRWHAHVPAKHLGIMSGPRHFIHAYQGHAVMQSPLVPQWRRRIAAAFAFPPIPQR